MSTATPNSLYQTLLKIPGVGGYLAREERRDIDKAYRETLANQLHEIKSTLGRVIRELTESGRLFEVKPLDRLSGKLDKLESRIRFAVYGYSGFFDLVKIDEKQLDNLHRFDRALAENIEELNIKLNLLLKEQSNKESLKENTNTLEAAIDSFDLHFSQRHQAIEKTCL